MPEQIALSLVPPPPPAPPVVVHPAQEQAENLRRVADRQRPAILSWLRARLESGMTRFHGCEIEVAVVAAVGGNAGSVTRVMRGLRDDGVIDLLTVGAKRASLYEIRSVRA